MTLTVSLAVLCAALLHASWNAMIKRGGGDVLLDTAGIVLGASVVTLPFAAVYGPPAPAAWPYLAASLTIHLAYYFLMVNAYRAGDLTLVYPLMRGVAPLITAVGGIVVLRETPAAFAWLGMLLVSGGVIMLAGRAFARNHASNHAPSRAAIGFALANAAAIAAYTLIDGKGGRLAGAVESYIVWLFALDALPLTLYMLLRHRVRFAGYLRRHARRALIGGALSAAAYAIALWAMTRAPVALVASLRETSVLFASLIGARLLKERLDRPRWIGIGAVVAGVMCLKAA
jgi:drug/metabolite transporter (DMT)-like permease